MDGQYEELESYLLMDFWSQQDAFFLLAGCHPAKSVTETDERHTDDCYFILVHNGDRVARLLHEDRYIKLVSEIVRLQNLWGDSDHDNALNVTNRSKIRSTRYKSAYYLEWAKKKRVKVPWLEIAIEKNWIDGEPNLVFKKELPDQNVYPAITGKTYATLRKAIDDFPAHYPNFSTRQPKLDSDLRPWLKAQYSLADRDVAVFSNIISEHFEFK
jgi:hypothetical protein